MSKNSTIIAFDLSTTVCGYTILKEGSLEWGFYKFQSKELLNRGEELIDFLQLMYDEYKFSTLIIEANLKSFQQGGTNASAMLKTSKMNFLCQVYAKKILNVKIVEYNVTKARNLWKPGFTKLSRLNKNLKDKEIAFNFVKKEVEGTNLVLQEKIISRGKNKGKVVPIDEAMDMSDSYVLMMAYLKENKNEYKNLGFS